MVPRNDVANTYVHRFSLSEAERAPHDHPYDNASWILDGTYLERIFHPPYYRRIDATEYVRRAGDVVHRRAHDAHSIELVDGPVVTLFTTGPSVRPWGFWCPGVVRARWVPFLEYVARERAEDGTYLGGGCG